MRKVIMINGLVEKDNMKEDVLDLFRFDLDFSGMNGIDYISTDAISNGYDSDLEYNYDMIYKNQDPGDLVTELAHVLFQSSDSYENYDLDFFKISEDKIYVSIMIQYS